MYTPAAGLGAVAGRRPAVPRGAQGVSTARDRRDRRRLRARRRALHGGRLRRHRAAVLAQLDRARLPVPGDQPAHRRLRRLAREPGPAAARDRRRGARGDRTRAGARRAALRRRADRGRHHDRRGGRGRPAGRGRRAGRLHQHLDRRRHGDAVHDRGVDAGPARLRAVHPVGVPQGGRLPVVGVGRFKDPLQAERALAEGHCDLVGVVRGQIADADFAAKARSGATDDIRLCLSCNQECVGRMGLNRWLGCIENPAHRPRARVRRRRRRALSARRRHVVVAGAGPAGLQAAIAAARKRAPGHRPRAAARMPAARCGSRRRCPTRAEFGDLVRNQLTECRRLGVTINYGVGRRGPASSPRSGPTRRRRHRRRAARPWWVPAECPNVVDVRDVLEGSGAPAGCRGRDRRARLPPGHVGRRAARRPGLRGRGRSPRDGRRSGPRHHARPGGLEHPRRSQGHRAAHRPGAHGLAAGNGALELQLLHHPTGTTVERTPDWVVLAVPASPVEWLYHELVPRRRQRPPRRRLRRPAARPRRGHRGRAGGQRDLNAAAAQ